LPIYGQEDSILAIDTYTKARDTNFHIRQGSEKPSGMDLSDKILSYKSIYTVGHCIILTSLI
jgi:hypothetical protein